MRAELEKRLRDTYPTAFRNGTIQSDGMVFGFQHGDGWFPLIEELLAEAAARYLDVKLDQVKEKFGGLRFYCSGGDDKFGALVRLAENLSFSMCETCGRTVGTDTTHKEPKGYWLRTLCPEHRAERDEEMT